MAKSRKAKPASSGKIPADEKAVAAAAPAAPKPLPAHPVMVRIGDIGALKKMMLDMPASAKPAIETLISKIAEISGIAARTTDIMELLDSMTAQTLGGGVYVDVPSGKLKECIPEAAAKSAPISGGSGASWVFGPAADIQRITVIYLKGAFSDSPPLAHERIPFDYLVTLIHELIHDAPVDRLKVYDHDPDPARHRNEMEDAARVLGANSLDDYIRTHCVPEQYR